MHVSAETCTQVSAGRQLYMQFGGIAIDSVPIIMMNILTDVNYSIVPSVSCYRIWSEKNRRKIEDFQLVTFLWFLWLLIWLPIMTIGEQLLK